MVPPCGLTDCLAILPAHRNVGCRESNPPPLCRAWPNHRASAHLPAQIRCCNDGSRRHRFFFFLSFFFFPRPHTPVESTWIDHWIAPPGSPRCNRFLLVSASPSPLDPDFYSAPWKILDEFPVGPNHRNSIVVCCRRRAPRANKIARDMRI